MKPRKTYKHDVESEISIAILLVLTGTLATVVVSVIAQPIFS